MNARINDFVIKIANVNGTGSASANGLLMKAIFRMGIPVVGKNFFPSNIQGLPTWSEIRVSREGYLARSGRVDIMVAMNAQTYARDLADVSPGGSLLSPNQYLTAAQVDAGNDWANVLSVQVGLLLRSNTGAVPRPAAAPVFNLLGTYVQVPIDTRLRRVFTATIYLRNAPLPTS